MAATAIEGDLQGYDGPIAPAALAAVVAAGLVVSFAAFFGFVYAISPDRAQETWAYIVERVVTTQGWKPLRYFGLLASVLVVEAFVLGWRRSSLHLLVAGSRSERTDIVVAGLHAIGWSALLMTAFTGGALFLVQDLRVPLGGVQLASYIQPVWLQIIVVFVVVDFLDYWYHRIMHEIEFLWEAHKYHHAATSFTILTGNRIHALEEAFKNIFVFVPLALMGAPAVMYVGVRYAILAFDMMQHSMVGWTYGWFGRWVLYSPVGHRIHHSPMPEHWDRNYGNILVIWDRLFGTYYSGPVVNDEVGVAHNPYNRRMVLTEYLLCAGWFVQSLIRSLRTWTWRTEYQRDLRNRRATNAAQIADGHWNGTR